MGELLCEEIVFLSIVVVGGYIYLFFPLLNEFELGDVCPKFNLCYFALS